MSTGTLVLSAPEVTALLDIHGCLRAVERTLRAAADGRALGPVSTGFALPRGSVHAKAAGVVGDAGSFVAVKANVNLPENRVRHRRPTIQGALMLLDAEDGRPLAIMDSVVLTSLRTAAVAALAADRLALPGAETVAIIGCGEQGHAQLRAMAAVRHIRRAFAIDRDPERAQALAAGLAPELDIPIETTASLHEAVEASQICVTCTTSASPFIEPSHLHAGLFVAAVGADNPAKQEIHATALAQSQVVVDSAEACAAGGELHHAIEAGLMTTADIHSELADLVSDRVAGRRAEDEVFIFDSTGTALQDVAVAVLVYTAACANGAGVRLAFAPA